MKIRGGQFMIPFSFSNGLSDLILRILRPDPVARITLKQIQNHPWFAVSVP